MMRLAAGGRLILAVAVASGVFVLSRDWTTQLATLPKKPITQSACPAEFIVVGEKPGGAYTLMAVFEYSDELKRYFYSHSKDRERTRRFLQETWPTAEILWPGDTGINLIIQETAMGDAARLLNEGIAEAHKRLGLFPTILEFQRTAADMPDTAGTYGLVVERGHIPEHYLYRVEGDEIVPLAYVAENRLGGVLVSAVLGAVGLMLILLWPRMGRRLGGRACATTYTSML